MTGDGWLLSNSLGAREQSTEPLVTVCLILLGMPPAECMAKPGSLRGLRFGTLAGDGPTLFFKTNFKVLPSTHLPRSCPSCLTLQTPSPLFPIGCILKTFVFLSTFNQMHVIPSMSLCDWFTDGTWGKAKQKLDSFVTDPVPLFRWSIANQHQDVNQNQKRTCQEQWIHQAHHSDWQY